jgi:2,4-dienoyl-CoA reductase-like NADH-dependent reductase (Old Yellow Enzyme family)
MEMKYPHLFAPIKLGGTVFRNRLFSAPVGYEYLTSQKFPNGECIAFYERKAKGGAATVCVGSAAADSRRGVVGQSGHYLDDPEALPPLYRLATSISRHGAVACVELQHAGSFSRYSAKCGNQIYGAVDTWDENGTLIPAMPEEIIEETIEAYANAAAFAKFCGFGMVMVHSGHGWLLSQFLQPQNNRKDRWGGSLENRCRLPIAICDRIKKKCGRDFPVDIRISGSECHPGGYDIDLGVAIARELDGHVDMIHVSAGSHEVPEVFTVTHPSMFLPDGVNVKYAAEIKKHVRTPVATVGALSDPALMAELIASGKADVVYTARALLSDPDLPKKARAGRTDEIRPCLRCFVCFSGITTKRQYRCAVNPEIGFEQAVQFELPPAGPKRVLVAGGGVAGMQAALTAAARGHVVTLAEKTDRLGGALRCEDSVPFKHKLREYLDYQERSLRRSTVDIRLNTDVTAAFAEAGGFDAVVAALGARPVKPGISGIDGENVLGAEEAYLHPEKTGQKVVILGGGLVGIELAIYLAGLGRGVTISR